MEIRDKKFGNMNRLYPQATLAAQQHDALYYQIEEALCGSMQSLKKGSKLYYKMS